MHEGSELDVIDGVHEEIRYIRIFRINDDLGGIKAGHNRSSHETIMCGKASTTL